MTPRNALVHSLQAPEGIPGATSPPAGSTPKIRAASRSGQRRRNHRRFAHVLLTLALGLGTISCDDETLSKTPDMPMTPLRCIDDSECAPRERCTSTGICVPLDICDENRPCPDPEQICADNDGDGYNDCFFERCQEAADCIGKITCDSDALIRCVDGRCLCGDPCQGGCPDGSGCCLPNDMCMMLPPQCGDLVCPRGQFISVTSTGAWDTGKCEVLGETCECVRYPPLALGDIGLHSAMAENAQNTYLSAYNLDYGDLMFGILSRDGMNIDWEFVDGVPSSTSAVTGDVDGPRGGLSEPGHDLGLYTDIEIDALGQPHIAYHDRSYGRLKYAIGTTTGWKIHTIDDAGTAGMYAHLTFTDDGRPRIAYLTLREERNGARYSALKLAVSNSLAPQDASSWTIRVVDEISLNPYGCEVRCNQGEVCRASDHTCFVPSPASLCAGGCPNSNEACFEGACVATDPIDPVTALPKASGLWPSMDLKSDGTAMIAYYNSIQGTLKLAEAAGPNPGVGAITNTVLDGTMTDDVGRFPSLFVSNTQETHISYMNQSAQSLMYKKLDSMGTSLLTETVQRGDQQSTVPGGDFVGADTALVVDSMGMARIAYQNGTTGTLRYARRFSDGSWNLITLRGGEDPYEGSFGFYVDQVLTQGANAPLVSSYRYWLSKPLSNGLVVVAAP
jgi:hypothetical protein